MHVNKDKLKFTTVNIDGLTASIKRYREATADKHKAIKAARGVDTAPFPGTGLFMGLDHEPASKEAKALTDTLVTMVHRHTGGTRLSSQRRKAVGAIAADLAQCLSEPTLGYCYRSTGSDSFGDALIKRNAFRPVLDAFADLAMCEARIGYRKLGGWEPTTGTRCRPLSAFADLLAGHGIDPVDWSQHFTRPYVPLSPAQTIILRAAHKRQYVEYGPRVTGRSMKVDFSDAAIAKKADTMVFINEYLSRQRYEVATFTGLRRIYNNGDTTGAKFEDGGRMFDHGGFQNIEKAARSGIRINGQPTIELDYGCCQPTILYALLQRPMPNRGDLYHSEEVPRDILKRFAIPLIGGGKIPRGWSTESALWYSRKYYGADNAKLLRRDFPAKLCRRVLSATIDVLRPDGTLPVRCHVLQNVESDIMVEVVRRLATHHDVPALPVHDSIVVPADDAEKAKGVMHEVFFERLGVAPIIKSA